MASVVLATFPWHNPERKREDTQRINVDSQFGVEHLGLLYLDALLSQEDITVQTYDFAHEGHRGKHYNLDEYVDKITSQNPSVVGMSPYYSTMQDTIRIAQNLKKRKPNTKIVLGGSHVGHTATEILKDIPAVDVVFRGEAFTSCTSLFNSLLGRENIENVRGAVFRYNGNPIANGWGPKANLDSLPFPSRPESLYRDSGTVSMMFSMGCPAACKFCSCEALRDRSWRARSPEKLIHEIVYLKDRLRCTHIETHADDAFGHGQPAKERYARFASILHENNIDITWSTVLRASDFLPNRPLHDTKFWSLLRDAGLHSAFIGFEAGTDERLRRIQKPATVEHNHAAYHHLHKCGIPLNYGFIMFFPDSTLYELEENMHFLASVDCAEYNRYSTSLSLYPGSAHFDEYRREGKLQDPIYGPQTYRFADESVARLSKWARAFAHEQENIDQLMKDMHGALVRGEDCAMHRGREIPVDADLYHQRKKELQRTFLDLTTIPPNPLHILSSFSHRWRTLYDQLTRSD